MAEKTAKKANTEEAEPKKEAVKQEKPKKEEAKFAVKRLAPRCEELFGVNGIIYAGATYEMNGEYTIEELKKIINKWKDKEVR